MGAVMASTDWRATPLGDPSGWIPALRTAAGLCLECRFPMLIMWGRELAMIYNDPFRPILAEKHPRSMGQPGAECWAEIWDVVGPMLHGVLDGGTTVWSEDQLMVLDRRGFAEDCYFTFPTAQSAATVAISMEFWSPCLRRPIRSSASDE